MTDTPTPEGFCVDLGSGATPPPGFVGIDLTCATKPSTKMLLDPTWCDPGEVYEFDLVRPLCDDTAMGWPLADGSVDYLRASHFVEHVPAPFWDPRRLRMVYPMVEFMREAHRVCRHGATVELVHPNLQSVRAFQDPTHCHYLPAQLWAYADRTWRQANDLDHDPYPHQVHMITTHVGVALMDESFNLRTPAAQEQASRWYWNVIADLQVLLVVSKYPDPDIDRLASAVAHVRADEPAVIETTAEVDGDALLERWSTGA